MNREIQGLNNIRVINRLQPVLHQEQNPAQSQIQDAQDVFEVKKQAYEQSLAQTTGWLGRATDGIRNFFGMRGGTKKTEEEFNEFKDAYNQYQNALNSGDEAALEVAKAELEEESAELDEQLEKRDTGNKAWADGLATAGAVAAGLGIAALVAATAPVSVPVLALGGIAAAAGGGVKLGMKWLDEYQSRDGESYTAKEGAKDFLTGAIDAGLACVGNWAGNLVRGSVGRAGGIVAGRLTEGMFDGTSGAVVEATRQVMSGEEFDAGRALGAGLGAGAAGTVMGGAFDFIGFKFGGKAGADMVDNPLAGPKAAAPEEYDIAWAAFDEGQKWLNENLGIPEELLPDSATVRANMSQDGIRASLGGGTQRQVPEYLYHVTSREHYESMLSDGVMKPSPHDIIQGVFLIDKDNFFKTWFDEGAEYGNISMTLLPKSEVLLKISTKDLSPESMLFRSYTEGVVGPKAYERFLNLPQDLVENVQTGKIDIFEFNTEARKIMPEEILGHPMEKIADYPKGALEYVYKSEIPMSKVEAVGQFDGEALPYEDMLEYTPEESRRFFEKLFAGDNIDSLPARAAGGEAITTKTASAGEVKTAEPVVDSVLDVKPATRLTAKANIKGEGYTVVSVPKELEGEPPKRYTVIGIGDLYRNKDIPIGTEKTIAHGDLVQEFVTHGLKDDVAVLAYDIDLADFGALPRMLDDMIDKKQNAPFKDYFTKANFSLGQNGLLGTNYEMLSQLTGLDINEGNILSLRNDIVSRFPQIAKDNDMEFLNESYKAIMKINELVDSGVDVYVAAGNEGAGNVNLLSLSKANIIGATDATGKVTLYSNESPLVTGHAQGTFGMRPRYDSNGNFIGVSPFDDGEVFFTHEMIGNLKINETISSFAGKQPEGLLSSVDVQQGLKEFEDLKGSIRWGWEVDDLKSKYDIKTGELFELNDDFRRLLAFQESQSSPVDLELETSILLRKLAEDDVASSAKYVAFDKSISNWVFFKTDAEGKLIVDYDGSVNIGQIAQISGTSFSTPTRLNENIFGKNEIDISQREPIDMDKVANIYEYLEYIQLLKEKTSETIRNEESIMNIEDRVFKFFGITKEEFLGLRENLKQWI